MYTRLACIALALALVGAPAIVLAGGGGSADGSPETAAATVDAVDGSAISLAPATDPGSNGQYVNLTGSGELLLQFDDLNEDAVTTAHEVFLVNVTAAEPAAVRVEDDADGVSFYWADDPTANASEPRTVQPGDDVAVGVQVDSVGAVGGGNVTVVAEPVSSDDEEGGGGFFPPPEDDGGSLTVRDADVSPVEIAVGESATATATVVNTGSSGASGEVELAIDGIAVDRRTVTVAGGETETVAFERPFQRAGEFAVAVGGVEAGTVTVVEGEAAGGFAVSNATLSPSSIQPGASATIAANVTNRGETAGTFTAELSVGGVVVEQQPVRVAAGATERVAFERTFERRGGYEIAVSGERAGTLRVESSTAASMRRYGSEYGWLLGLATVPTLGGAFVAARRRQRVVEDD